MLQAMAAEPVQDNSILLKNLVPLNALSDEHLGQLISRVSVERLQPGTFLFREGDTDHQHVYLLEGTVTLLSGEREVDSVRSGSNTARFALAHQWPRKFSARARSEVRVVRVDSHVLSELLVRTQTQSYRVSELDADASGDWMSRVLRSRVFQQIPAANIQSVLRRMERVEAAAGDVIMRQGEPGDYYYVIIQGACTITRQEGGQLHELAHLGPGEGFGEQALVGGRERSGTVRMTSRGTLVRLPKDDFLTFIKQPLISTLKPAEAKTRVEKGAYWLDVRSAAEYARSHLPDAINLPLEAVRSRTEELDADTTYVVYGTDTSEGAVGAFLLRERGCDVALLEGGIGELPAELLAGGEEPSGDAGTEDDMPPTLPLSPEHPLAQDPPDTGAAQERIRELESQLQDTQTRYHRALYQRVAENRRLKQQVDRQSTAHEALQGELKRLRATAPSPPPDATDADIKALRTENQRLRERVQKMEADLEELETVLQEASAEESTYQWERLRLDARIKALERSLAEQQAVNRVLQEESEETQRRLEALRKPPQTPAA